MPVSGSQFSSRVPPTIGPYQVVRELGRGGTGVVVLARAAEREVAIKLLLGLDHSDERLARFAREREVLGELAEAGGFVGLLDTGTCPEGPYLVMPYVPAGTLADRLLGGPQDPAVAVGWVSRLARAIGRAHQRGIVHRDLKPANVLFTEDGEPLIADLGLAKHLRAAPSGHSLSRTGEMRGTPGYMAPEQIEDAKSIGPPADVFALGAVLYAAVSGRPAFTGPTYEVLAAILNARFEPLSEARPDLPAALGRLIEQCLSPDPKARPANGDALAEALESCSLSPPRRLAPLVAGGVVLIGLLLSLGLLAFDQLESAGVSPDASPTPPATAPPPASLESTPELPYPSLHQSARLRLTQAWDLGSGPIRALSWSGDGDWLALGCEDGSLWAGSSLQAPERLIEEAHAGGTFAVALSPEGDLVASGGADGTPRLWERVAAVPREWKHVAMGTINRVTYTTARWLEDDRVLFKARGQFALHLVVVARGDQPLSFARSLRGGVSAVSHDDSRLVTGDEQGLLRVVEAAPLDKKGVQLSGTDDQRPPLAQLDGEITALALGSLIYAGLSDGRVVPVDPVTGKTLQALLGHTGPLAAFCWLEPEVLLASSSGDGTVRLWSLATESEVERLDLQAAGLQPTRIEVSSTGRLAVATEEGTLLIFELGKP